MSEFRYRYGEVVYLVFGAIRGSQRGKRFWTRWSEPPMRGKAVLLDCVFLSLITFVNLLTDCSGNIRWTCWKPSTLSFEWSRPFTSPWEYQWLSHSGIRFLFSLQFNDVGWHQWCMLAHCLKKLLSLEKYIESWIRFFFLFFSCFYFFLCFYLYWYFLNSKKITCISNDHWNLFSIVLGISSCIYAPFPA